MAINKSIGIKLYNDSFVPVLKSDELKSKRLVLTTVRNNQKKAIIELYEGSSEKCINNEYLGKLVINIDRETIKGEPAIEVNLRQDTDGILYAKAWDTVSNEQSEIQIEHSVNKTILNDTINYNELKKSNIVSTEISDYEREKDNLNILKIIIIILIILFALGLLSLGGFFIYKYKDNIGSGFKKMFERKQKIDENKKTMIIDDNDKEKEDKDQEKPMGYKNVHHIKWGDNLWNICKKYYNNPWYYAHLAEINNIKNPRLIYAGDTLNIPDKSELEIRY